MPELLQVFSQVARPIILQHFKVNSCIASTLVTIKVLQHFGVAAEPFPVVAYVFNPAYIACLERGDRPSDDLTQKELIRWLDQRHAWSIACGVPGGKTGDDSVGWEGHLVTVIRHAHIFIDASIDQVNRPARKINFPPVIVANAPQGFLDGKESVWYSINKSALEYKPIINDRFTHSGDWNLPARTDPVAKQIVSLMEDLL